MSNLESQPTEMTCRPAAAPATDAGDIAVEILTSRAVPLGGPRAMTVHRTLPQRRRSLVGAWCFADHYGPDDVGATGGMDVPPHPHTGLQTVSWLFAGEIEHRDTMGNRAMVRPGEINLMTAGHGIAHTEVSTPETTVLHGVQLWVALPAAAADTARAFDHFAPPSIDLDGVSAKVFIGNLFDAPSPIRTFTPLLGAELVFAPGAHVTFDVDPGFEHAILVDNGTFGIDNSDGSTVERTQMAYIGLGATELSLTNTSDETGRIVLLGGAPLHEDIIMWWNFIGRTHDEIVTFREQWMAHSDRFGQVEGYTGEIRHLPAPALPTSHLRPRANTPGNARPASP